MSHPGPYAAPHLVRSPLGGTVVAVLRGPGERVGATTALVVVESMKMEHPVPAGVAGVVASLEVGVGEQIGVDAPVATVAPEESASAPQEAVAVADLDRIRPDLAQALARRDLTRDSARPEAVRRRHTTGHRTARENVADLVEPGSFVEYGSLPVAAQRSRRDLEDLIATTPADGIVTGLGRVNADAQRHGECMILAYDYTVLAGTQGFFNHKKTDRALRLAHRRRMPVVVLAEGGGGRPGDVDAAHIVASGLDVETFAHMGRLSGWVPTVAVVTGRCFAGNAAVAGCCDVVIATRDATIGMAGPAMIEGGGLGRFAPEEIGPMSVQGPNGVVDIVVEDDAAAIAAARRYLGYVQGSRADWSARDQRELRVGIPENRKQAYAVRSLIEILADTDSVLELRAEFGVGIVTALVRIEGMPMGLVANNPAHLGGAIDADAADKLARFLQLCDAHGLPIVSLCDTPGFMVGPEAERAATVRHVSRLFVVGANLRVPLITIVLRKAYGLGAQAMAGGGFREPVATIAWPTGEVGGMGLEGAVRLGYARELEAIADPDRRAARFDDLVEQHYAQGKATNAAMLGEIDEVIDPAETRAWIRATLGDAIPGDATPSPAGHRFIDTW
ncbi:MAG: biotin carboxylase [Tetrasphaera sp.]|nr:biotin carboxylase [Tetrasphaera sp.]